MTDAAQSDAQLARRIAESAGEILVAIQRSRLFEDKALGKVGDRVANAFIMEALARHRPDDAVLSEEEKADPIRLVSERVWIVDPLDGTREYGERRTDWAVHVALTIDGAPAAGAVALPGVPQVLDTDTPPAVPALNGGPLRMVVSRTRPAAEAVAVAERLGAELVGMGSAGAKAMSILRGEADIYLHTGGQYEWDSCAPVAVVKAAGLHASRVDGSPLVYNAENPYLPDLLICREEHAETILGLMRQLSAR